MDKNEKNMNENQCCDSCRFCVIKEIRNIPKTVAEMKEGKPPEVICQCQRYAPGHSRAAVLAPFVKGGNVVELTRESVNLKMVVVNSWVEIKPCDWCGEYAPRPHSLSEIFSSEAG